MSYIRFMVVAAQGLEKIRRMSIILAAIAFVLPLAPSIAGLPVRDCFGFRAGSDACALYSLVLFLVALVGIACTQSTIHPSLRWWTLPKVLFFAVSWVVLTSSLI